jgi:hypothetical protein
MLLAVPELTRNRSIKLNSAIVLRSGNLGIRLRHAQPQSPQRAAIIALDQK